MWYMTALIFQFLLEAQATFLILWKRAGTGGVLSLANVFPEACADLYKLYKAGDMDKAVRLKDDLVSLNKRVSGKYGVAGVKYAMDLAGFYRGKSREDLLKG